jgi:hypothetical protein
MSATHSIQRALALLGAASNDWRNGGPSDGSSPLHWPVAVAAARAHLEQAIRRDDELRLLLSAAAALVPPSRA